MATGRCKCCNKPLCNDCKHVTDIGVFCSPECESKTRNFQSKVNEPTVRYRKSVFTKRTLSGLVLFALILAGVGAFFRLYLGIDSLADMRTLLASWWEARHLIF
jgi:hypothetical protein